jgi:hypothetical protein
MAKPRKRRRRRVGAAIAIFLAFAVGATLTLGTDSLLWGTLAGLGVGALGWGVSSFFPGSEVVLADLADDDDDRGDGLSDDGGLGDN